MIVEQASIFGIKKADPSSGARLGTGATTRLNLQDDDQNRLRCSRTERVARRLGGELLLYGMSTAAIS